MSACGLWPNRTGFIAVIVDDRGQAGPPIRVAPTREAATALLSWLHALTIDAVVLGERNQPLLDIARALGLSVQIAPHGLLEAIRNVTGLDRRCARETATLLARWHRTAGLREYLRQPPAATPHTRQIPLL